MNRHLACLVFTLASAGVCSGQYYDRIDRLKDAPFSAEAQGSETTPDSSNTWIVEIARAGDGSVYEATIDTTGEFKGSIRHIDIADATSNCNIGISPYRSLLSRDSQGRMDRGEMGLSIGLEEMKAPVSPSPTIEGIRDRNLREQRRISMNPAFFNPDAKMRQTSLGQRTVGGMTIYGFQEEHRLDSKTDRIEERWESELGFTYSSTRTNPTDGRISARRLAGLKLAEPPAELFTVQDKHFPPTWTLPNARTIFFAGVSGNAELTHQIESILAASGRFTIVPDSKTADLVVVASQLDPSPPGYPANASLHQILLKFNKPGGGSVFWVTLHLHGASDQWSQSPVVNTCFANLWKRAESLQAPPASIDDEPF